MKTDHREFLFANSDEKYKAFHIKLTPGIDENKVIGVRVPVLRDYAKKLKKEGITPSDIPKEYYEEIMLCGMLTGLEKYADADAFIAAVKDFLPYITNWAICDIFCGGLKQTKKFAKDVLDFIRPYAYSDKEYEARFAAVMLLDHYITDEYIDGTLLLLKDIHQEGYYAKMAVAWAYSAALVKYYDKTLQFIKTAELDKFTHNKSIQKARESYRLTEQQKAEVNVLRKR